MKRPKRTKAPESAKAEPTEERTALMFGMWLERGEGWVWVRARIPLDVVKQYAEHVSVPDLRGVAVGKLVQGLEEHAIKGGS